MNQQPLESVRDIIAQFVGYLPTLLAGLVVLLLGLLVAWVAAKLVGRLFVVLRLDRVLGRIGWGRALQRGDVRHTLFETVGTVVGALVFLVFLDNAAVIWRLTVLSRLLEDAVLMIPKLLIAGFVLLLGWAIAAAVSRTVLRALLQEDVPYGRIVARVVSAAILVVAWAIALVELGIAKAIVTGAFLIAFGALALSAAIAFGLGSKRAVEIMWEERFRRRQAARAEQAGKPAEK